MTSAKSQHAGSHARYFPLYHFFVLPVTLLYAMDATQQAFASPVRDALIHAVWAWGIVAGVLAARVMALTVQDRVIRLEETLRMLRLLPAGMHGDIAKLSRRQFVALRFASDDELPELVRRTVADEFNSTRALKRAIRTWRPDWFRA